MADTPQIEVDTTKQQSGKVVVGIRAFNLLTPTILARVTKALRYFCVSLITMVSATTIFNGNQSKIITFCLGVFILLTGAVDVMIGIDPDKK